MLRGRSAIHRLPVVVVAGVDVLEDGVDFAGEEFGLGEQVEDGEFFLGGAFFHGALFFVGEFAVDGFEPPEEFFEVVGSGKEKGLTQKNLAKKAGVSAPWLSDAENGKPTVEVGLVFRVLRTLGCSLSVSDEPVDILSIIPHSGNPDAAS